jgi:hypothetical protein
VNRMFVTAVLSYLLNGLAELAKATTTKIDDEAVDVGRAILAEGVLLDWFYGKVTAPDGTLALEAGPSPEVLSVLSARNIDWEKFLSAATTLISLFRMFAGK